MGHIVLGHKVMLDIDGPEGYTVQVSLGGHRNVDGGVDWEGPYDFEVGSDSYVDFAVAGKYLALRIESANTPIWTLQGYAIEYEVIGRS